MYAHVGAMYQGLNIHHPRVTLWAVECCLHIYQLAIWKNKRALTCTDTIKKAEHQRIDAFELWCWRKLLRVPWTARRPNQSILKEISPEYSLEGLMLKLKLQYFGYLMQRTDLLQKTMMLGKIEGRRRRGQQRTRWLDGITDSMDMSLSKLRKFEQAQGSLGCCSPWGCRVGNDWVTELILILTCIE